MITVFTPTYNRAYSLPNLYDSLCKQSFVDFEWLLIDDGSTDRTVELAESLGGTRTKNQDSLFVSAE